MDKGYIGKILMVDLTDGTFEEQEIADSIYKKFLSGSGLADLSFITISLQVRTPWDRTISWGLSQGF
jgi:aldehyde:ferredoxin oxidoreductase